jgi:PKD repeat protein
MKFGLKWKTKAGIGALAFSCSLSLFAQLIPASRLVPWAGNVGIPGGIPRRTTIFTNLTGIDATGATDVSAKIQSAIDRCPAGQVVYLPAGTYRIDNALTISSSITLRGAGPDNTILKGTISGRNGIVTITSAVLNGQSSSADIVSGATKGSTNLTIAAADSNLHPGYVMMVDQLNDGTFIVNDASDPGGYQRTDTDDRSTGTRNNSQAVEVKAVSGANIAFWPPLVWTFTNSPQIYYRRASSTSNNYVQNAGVEDMCLRNVNPDTTSYYNLYFNRSAYCWANNVRTENGATSHIEALNSFRLEIRHCTLSNSVNTASSYGYALDLEYQTCSSLVEDNIFVKTRDFIKVDAGSSGNAILFNYHTNALANPAVPNFAVHNGGAHSAHPMMNLFEGNVTYKPVFDFYWGSSSHQTVARNWFRGPMAYAYQSAAAIIFDQGVTFYNVVGNVLGNSGVNSNPNWTSRYSTRISPQSHPYEHSYATFRVGYFSDGDAGGGNNAAQQWADFIVGGNYDYVTGSQAWYNPTTAQPIPDSYFYSSKPAYFGNLQWPPIDPSGPRVGETAIPAGYRFTFGKDPTSTGNQSPIVSATGTPKSGPAPLTVNFSSAGSSDPEGTALAYNWVFGDGTTSTSSSPSHTYQVAGTYLANLTISDGTNSVTSTNISISASSPGSNQPPVAVATASPTNGVVPLNVVFSSNGSSDPEGAALTYNWVFGDGTTSALANPSHSYQTAGAYVARLTVSDGTNSATSGGINIVATPVANRPPTVVASATPTNGVAPLAVSFSSNGSSDPEGSTLTYSWNFGDGASATTPNPNHTYQSSGNFTAVLTVSDGTNSTSASIRIAASSAGPVAAYGFEEGSGAATGDDSGNGNSGTISGATWVTGKFGKGLSFNGSSSLVTIPDSSSLDLTTMLTLEAWVNLNTIGADWASVIFKPVDASSLSYVLQGVSQPSQAPSLGISASSSNLVAPSPLPTNTWTHLAATYDGTTMRLYVNGALVASRAQTGAITTSGQALTIGGNPLFGAYFSGQIDEVRIYDRALSSSEIQNDMTTPIVIRPSAPTGLRVVGP